MNSQNVLQAIGIPVMLTLALFIVMGVFTTAQSPVGAALWLFVSPVLFIWIGRASARVKIQLVPRDPVGEQT